MPLPGLAFRDLLHLDCSDPSRLNPSSDPLRHFKRQGDLESEESTFRTLFEMRALGRMSHKHVEQANENYTEHRSHHEPCPLQAFRGHTACANIYARSGIKAGNRQRDQ